MVQIRGASQWMDRHGDIWTADASGYLRRGGRLLRYTTVDDQLGPLRPHQTHADDGPGGLDAELARAREATAGPTDADRVAAVRRLALAIERDPYRIPPEAIAAAILAALDGHA
jgi:hypothetical protein